ncbi:MAG: hypothetical protein A2Y60_02795 [Chloroflexi bacterium RBG_13_54_9]|nr:MAG: hypothetical protein A2Y60_02795 [Chloroflexi bacterium RBG_13_54_9]
MISGIAKNLRLFWRLMKDNRVPLTLKMIVPGTLLYLILPADLVPDLLPGLGHLDDIAILLLGFVLFLQLCPKPIVQQHLREMDSATTHNPEPQDEPRQGDTYIEPPYRIVEDDGQSQR